MKPLEYPGVNAEAICDCGKRNWRVGIEADAATLENHIRCLQCIDCGNQLAIPFQQGEEK